MKNKEIKLKINKFLPKINVWKYKTALIAHENAKIEAVKGHGLGSTKWKGCFCNFFNG